MMESGCLLCKEARTLLIATTHYLPVDDVPDLLEMLGTSILVVEVVGVLPDIYPEDRDKANRDGVAPIRLLGDIEATMLICC